LVNQKRPSRNPRAGAARLVLSLAVLVGLAAIAWLISTGGCSDPTADVTDAGVGTAKAVQAIQTNPDDSAFRLDGANTDIKWTGSNSVGQKPTGFFYELSGKAIVDSQTNVLRLLNLDIDMDGVKAMSSSLTQKLKHKGFFEVDKFPKATFRSTEVQPLEESSPSDNSNFVVEGNFQLRDVTQSIKIPVLVTVDGDKLTIQSKFKINRKDYGVVYSDTTGDKLIRDSVLIEISIDSTRNTDPEPAEAVAAATTDDPNSNATDQPIGNFTQTIEPTLVDFDMIHVPGDESEGIKPFWIGKTEVTWDEFDYWALCKNLYCKWLTKQTGRNYRLPTASEWDHAFELGGGDLDQTSDSKQLKEKAWFAGNAFSTDDEGFDFESTMPVGKLQPNSLGIHDMLGNAAEWVSGDAKVVRGGHFKIPADKLIGEFQEAEDQAVWNKDYPLTRLKLKRQSRQSLNPRSPRTNRKCR